MAKKQHNGTTPWKNWSLACAERSRSVIGHWSFRKGFTLAELIVSVAITGILMLGLSTFFSSTFHNLFRAQTQTANIGRQFAVNEIIRNKFNSLDYLVEDSPDRILSFNRVTKNQLPFSYIGTTEVENDEGEMEDHLAFKDIIIFNKIIDPGGGSYVYGNSGTGELKNANGIGSPNPNLMPSDTLKNFAGFVKVGTTYYVAVPHENAIMKCPSGGSCTPLNFDTQLLSPTDVTYGEIQVEGVDKEYLFISDSENGRVIKYEIGVGEHPQPLATGLKYPTGLAYYETTKDAVTYKYLFIAETLNHKIRK